MRKRKEIDVEFDESEIDWSSGELVSEDELDNVGEYKRYSLGDDLEDFEESYDSDYDSEEDEDLDEDDLDLDDIDEETLEPNAGKDLVNAFSTYIKEKHNLKFGGVKKKRVGKIKCDSPKKFALIMSQFDGNAVLDLSNKGIKFTYLVRAPEELYRITLTVDRKDLLVVFVGTLYGLDLEKLQEIYYNAIQVDVLEYRLIKAQGIAADDCFFKEVMFVSRYFMDHLLSVTIDWGKGELDDYAAEVVDEFHLGYYENIKGIDEDSEDGEELDEGSVDGIDSGEVYELEIDYESSPDDFGEVLEYDSGSEFELEIDSESDVELELDIDSGFGVEIEPRVTSKHKEEFELDIDSGSDEELELEIDLESEIDSESEVKTVTGRFNPSSDIIELDLVLDVAPEVESDSPNIEGDGFELELSDLETVGTGDEFELEIEFEEFEIEI